MINSALYRVLNGDYQGKWNGTDQCGQRLYIHFQLRWINYGVLINSLMTMVYTVLCIVFSSIYKSIF